MTRAVIIAPDRANLLADRLVAATFEAARAGRMTVVCALRAGAIEARFGAATKAAGARVVIVEGDAGFGRAIDAGVAACDATQFVAIGCGEPAEPSFERALRALDGGAGVVGPRVVLADGGEQCGLFADSLSESIYGFSLGAFGGARERMTCDAFASDGLAFSRSAYDEVGGFAEAFGNDFDAIDFCLRVGERDRAVVVEPGWTLRRLPARRPDPDARRAGYGERAFAERWRERIVTHENWWPERLYGTIVRRDYEQERYYTLRLPVPPTILIVHGRGDGSSAAFLARVRDARRQPDEIWWVAEDEPPAGIPRVPDAGAALARATEVRADRYVAFVRRDTQLGTDWLNELIVAAERRPRTIAAAVTGGAATPMPATVDGRCTLVRLAPIPQHLRIAALDDVDRAVADWLARAVDLGRSLTVVERSRTIVGPAAFAPAAAAPPTISDAPVFVSIVMLSWNAPDFTELAVESIRAHTSLPYEIIVIDNGSKPETVERLRRIAGLRLIENPVNTGFAFGCNQGLAAARGTHVVLLNNDVIVTDGWLEAMIDIQRRTPTIGCSAPVSNRISGPQQVDVPYQSRPGIALFAEQRRRERRGWRTDIPRVIGFCLCLDRRVIEVVGGLDPRYASGNFEDDDYCIRIRAAGYDLAFCEDAFVHHFGSVSFHANGLPYGRVFDRNLEIFEERWGIRIVDSGYDPNMAPRRGFQYDRDYVPLPAAARIASTWTPP